MEEQRIIIQNKLKNCWSCDKGLNESFRAASQFLEKPLKYWASAAWKAKDWC
jgi:hypothetical protein